MSALETVAGKSLTANLLQKLIFRSGILCYHCADTDTESLKSLHTLFDKYLDHMRVKLEQNRMVQTIKFWSFWEKQMVNHFWQSVDAILEDVSVNETIIWC